MGKCGSCKFKGHCDTTSELYGVPKYNGGCQYYEQKSDGIKTAEDVSEMLDLFYANIHLNKKLRKDKKHENNRNKPGC